MKKIGACLVRLLSNFSGYFLRVWMSTIDQYHKLLSATLFSIFYSRRRRYEITHFEGYSSKEQLLKKKKKLNIECHVSKYGVFQFLIFIRNCGNT
jgi:hypothetical protein